MEWSQERRLLSRTTLKTPAQRETGETHSLSQHALQTTEGPGVCGGEQARRIPQHPAARAGFGFPLSLSIETLYGRPENLSWSITSGFFFFVCLFFVVIVVLFFSKCPVYLVSKQHCSKTCHKFFLNPGVSTLISMQPTALLS